VRCINFQKELDPRGSSGPLVPGPWSPGPLFIPTPSVGGDLAPAQRHHNQNIPRRLAENTSKNMAKSTRCCDNGIFGQKSPNLYESLICSMANLTCTHSLHTSLATPYNELLDHCLEFDFWQYFGVFTVNMDGNNYCKNLMHNQNFFDINLPSQPFLGCHLGFHIFFTMACTFFYTWARYTYHIIFQSIIMKSQYKNEKCADLVINYCNSFNILNRKFLMHSYYYRKVFRYSCGKCTVHYMYSGVLK